jgi:glycosyltransferase involved in cell wall biosynthesis
MARPLRILQLCPFFHPVVGGLERIVLRLSVEMMARGHHVTVFTSDLTRTGRIAERSVEVEGVPVRRFPAWVRLGQFASLWPGFCRALKSQRFDIIHAHSYRHPHCDLASLRAVKGPARLILEPHWAAYPRPAVGTIATAAYDRVLGWRVFRAADLVLSATPLEVPWLHRMGARRTGVLPHGIPPGYLGRTDGQAFRARHGIGGFLVTSVGRIDESKGFQWVVRALPRLPGVRYAIAGPPGPFYPELLGLIKSLRLEDRVLLLGHITEEEKLGLLDATDVFVHPSRFEAFGVSLLEALARGLPCVGSRVGGVPWLLEDCGLLVEPGDVDGIAERLGRLRADAGLRQSLSIAGRAKAATMTWDRVAARYEQIVSALVSR